ncbi:MAG: fliK, partial [Caulobacteraceae bacterium]|nr:fliK [Caulobacteraceae bacterium]
MSRVALPLAALALVFSLQRAAAQEAPPPPVATAPPVVEAPPPEPAPPPPIDPSVNVSTLAAPDAFSVAGRQTGLPQDLWRETPRELMRAVLPLIDGKPLTPTAAALARRVLATGAPGPKGSSDDAGASDSDLAGARAGALVALGDVEAAAAILQRAPGVDRSSALSQAAAESALLAGDETRACAVAQALTVGRDDIYWLRLRAYCQAIGGQASAAHLTLDLAQAQARDATFGRLMTAKLGGGAAGAASLRNGLDLALSRSLGLDLTTAKASPAVAQALSGGPPATVEIAPPAADLAAFAEAMAA